MGEQVVDDQQRLEQILAQPQISVDDVESLQLLKRSDTNHSLLLLPVTRTLSLEISFGIASHHCLPHRALTLLLSTLALLDAQLEDRLFYFGTQLTPLDFWSSSFIDSISTRRPR